MHVITTTNILFERKVIDEGTQMEVSDEQGRSLIQQGVAEAIKAEMPKGPAPAPKAKDPAPVSVSKDMKREELETVAEGLGMEELEQFDTKAKLVEAIKERQNG